MKVLKLQLIAYKIIRQDYPHINLKTLPCEPSEPRRDKVKIYSKNMSKYIVLHDYYSFFEAIDGVY